MTITHYKFITKYKQLTTGEGHMALRDFQNNRTFARRFVRTSLSTKMKITLLGSTTTHEADSLRKPVVTTVNIEYGLMSIILLLVSH